MIYLLQLNGCGSACGDGSKEGIGWGRGYGMYFRDWVTEIICHESVMNTDRGYGTGNGDGSGYGFWNGKGKKLIK